LLRVLSALGDCHRRMARYRQAQECLEQAHHMLVTSGADAPGPLAAMLNLLGRLAKDSGAYDEAARHYRQVADIHREHGVSPADAAMLEHDLAALAQTREQYALAEAHARRAVTLRVTALAEPTDVALDVAVLAAAIAAQGRLEGARQMARRALEMCRHGRPFRRHEFADHLYNLATIEQKCLRPDDAEHLYREALDVKERLLGEEHPEVGQILHGLGTLLYGRGRVDEAAACYDRAARVVTGSLPAAHPLVNVILDSLNETARAAGEDTKAGIPARHGADPA